MSPLLCPLFGQSTNAVEDLMQDAKQPKKRRKGRKVQACGNLGPSQAFCVCCLHTFRLSLLLGWRKLGTDANQTSNGRLSPPSPSHVARYDGGGQQHWAMATDKNCTALPVFFWLPVSCEDNMQHGFGMHWHQFLACN